MTTLPERLQDVIVEFRRIAKDHEIRADRPHQDDATRQWHMGTSEAYDDAADRLEAAQALQAAPERGDLRGMLDRAYLAGWCNAARWADREDLIADEGSRAYETYRDPCIVALLAAPSPTAALQAGET